MSEKFLSPIIFSSNIPVRFADLDAYGHVNTTHYMDYVISSRFKFLNEKHSLSPNDITGKGLGFFLRDFQISFFKPIDGKNEVKIVSHVENLQGSDFEIPFSLTDAKTETLFSKGRFVCVFIDMNTKKTFEIPNWFIPYIFNS